ncbi:MAG: VOC family protein [Acidimicrobiia bacterium]|nr:VOC family protein [Acidimicrobiia bacterium]
MDVLFIAGFAAIAPDPVASGAFYRDALGLPLEVVSGNYISSDGIDGAKHFAVWPLADCATSCFGTDGWPDDIPVPHATIEFEVADVAAAAAELVDKGYTLVHDSRDEPWGQTVARLLGPEGLLVGLSSTPWLHE